MDNLQIVSDYEVRRDLNASTYDRKALPKKNAGQKWAEGVTHKPNRQILAILEAPLRPEIEEVQDQRDKQDAN